MIGKNKLKKTISFILFVTLFTFVSCINDSKQLKNKVEVLNISGKEVLNQAVYFKDNSIDYSKSQFYKIYNKNCIKYYSMFDTLNAKIGVDRFIIFKTSDSLMSDFSNINDIKLEEFFFKDKNYLCVDRKNIPSYGVIEDVVFLKSDSIINGEKSKRIKTVYQYINFKKTPKWAELEDNIPN